MNLMNQIGSKKLLKMYYLVMTVTRIIRAVNSPGRFKPVYCLATTSSLKKIFFLLELASPLKILSTLKMVLQEPAKMYFLSSHFFLYIKKFFGKLGVGG